MKPLLPLILFLSFAGCQATGSARADLASDLSPSRDRLPARLSVLVWSTGEDTPPGWFPELLGKLNGRDLVLLQDHPRGDEHLRAMLFQRRLSWNSVGFVERSTSLGSVANPSTAEGFLSEPSLLMADRQGCIVARFPSELGPELLVVNLRLLDDSSDAAMSRQLQPLEAAILSHRGPVLVAGDFGIWSSTRLETVGEFARRCELTEVRPEQDKRAKSRGYATDRAYLRGAKSSAVHVIETVLGRPALSFKLDLTAETH